MKKIVVLFSLLACIGLLGGFFLLKGLGRIQQAAVTEANGPFYGLKTRTLSGTPIDLAQFAGKVALVVNVASKCGLTPQYAGIEALYREFSDQGFVVLAFPSNDFLGQEPGTPAEIQEFCTTQYSVTFPLFEKVKVKGEHKCEVYRILTQELPEPDWNFTKYLVDAQGRVRYRFGPRVAPEDQELRRRIKELLAAP
jgi:glutathione peroxidase